MSTKPYIQKILCMLIAFPAVFADASSENHSGASSSVDSVSVNDYIYCPTIESLARDDVNGKWNAPGGWFSQHYSFSTKIDNFLGAAYIGNEIGHVECYFSSNQTGDVRIVLKNTRLVQIPSIDAWQPSDKNPKVKVCKQSSNSGCPFLVYNQDQHIDSLEDTILNIPK